MSSHSTPAPVTPPPLDPAPDGPTERSARLTMGARVGLRAVDGTWWPYSYDASTEFPALVAALAPHIGRVERIGYDMDLWQSAARKLVCGGVVVRCEGFHAVFSHLVSIISGPGQAHILLVISPEISDDIDIARASVSAAADASPGDTVENILSHASTAADHPSSAARALAATPRHPIPVAS